MLVFIMFSSMTHLRLILIFQICVNLAFAQDNLSVTCATGEILCPGGFDIEGIPLPNTCIKLGILYINVLCLSFFRSFQLWLIDYNTF